MKDKIKEYIESIKTWSLIQWIINFRFFGYGIIMTNILMEGFQESIPTLVMFGGIVLLIERQVRKNEK